MFDKSMQLTVIGSGTMVPTKERNPSAFLLELDRKRILLDCGHCTIRRLIDLNIDPQSIDAVFISHFHTDHFGDAFNLVHSRWVDDNYQNKSHRPLLFIGPIGLKERFGMWRKIYWPEPEESYPLKFKEGELNLEIGDIGVKTFQVYHVPWFQSVGIEIQYSGKTIIYTGDVGSKHDFNLLVKQVRNADLLITEASYEFPTPNHYTIEQIKTLAERANISKVLIVHVRPQHVERVKVFIRDNSRFQLAEDSDIVRV